MSADMKTIAERVGVSKTTVHRALANAGRISPETREKILKVAQELDYRPNNLARGLRSQKSASVGLVVIGLTNSFYATILEGVESIATDNGYSVLIARTLGNPSRELRHLDVLREKRADGMIIAPAHPGQNVEYYRKLRDSGIPFVFIDRHVPAIESDYVMTDNYLGGYMAGRHLVALGRKKIGFGALPGFERVSTSVTERLRGLTAALEEAGLEPPVLVGGDVPPVSPQESYAAAGVKAFFDGGGRIDGILGPNDDSAIGIIKGLKEVGLRIPDDVSVIGFDDLDIAPYVQPALTTVRQPARQIGEEALRLLLDRINSDRSDGFRHVLLAPELIVRESCGARSEAEPSGKP